MLLETIIVVWLLSGDPQPNKDCDVRAAYARKEFLGLLCNNNVDHTTYPVRFVETYYRYCDVLDNNQSLIGLVKEVTIKNLFKKKPFTCSRATSAR